MTPRRAADRGTAATLAGSESLGEVATPTCTPWVGPGCDDRPLSRRRWPGPCACPPAAGAPLHSACSHRGLRCHPAGPRTAVARQTARRGPGSRPRCSALRCLASSTLGLPVTSGWTMFRPSTLAAAAAHRTATSPPLRSTRMLPSNRTIRWASSGGTRSSMSFSSSLRRCSASRGWVLDSGGLDLPGHHWAASSAGGGCAAPGSPVAAPALAGPRCSATVITHRVLARPCGLRRRLSWPVLV
jgi:hypothetical protein